MKTFPSYWDCEATTATYLVHQADIPETLHFCPSSLLWFMVEAQSRVAQHVARWGATPVLSAVAAIVWWGLDRPANKDSRACASIVLFGIIACEGRNFCDVFRFSW